MYTCVFGDTSAPLDSRLETTKNAFAERHSGEKQCTGEKATERGGAWKEGGRRKHATNGAVRSIVERRDARGQYERHRAGQHRGMEI